MSGNNQNEISFEALFETTNLSESTRKHLSSVYAHLISLLATAMAGSAVGMVFTLSPVVIGLGFFVSLVATLSMDSKNGMRLPALLAVGFFKGASLAPLLSFVAGVSASLILTALLATSVIFVSFSVVALHAERRLTYYLSGVLSSLSLVLLLSLLLSVFGLGAELMFSLQLYLGLLMFMGYVIYDTQMMIARAESGIKDPVQDSIQLFIDFVGVFVRILLILTDKAKND